MSENTQAKRRGRPPKPIGNDPRGPLTVRLRSEIRQGIEESAAKSGRSLSEEIEARLEAASQIQSSVTEILGGPELRHLGLLMISAFAFSGGAAARAAGHDKWSAKKWLSDRDCFRSALVSTVDALCSAMPDQSAEALHLTEVALRNRIASRIARESGSGSGFIATDEGSPS